MTNSSDSYRLSPTQQSFLFEAVRNPHSGVGILQLILTFEEQFDTDAFGVAMRLIVKRHDSLRKSFPQDAGNLCQVINEEAHLSRRSEDWRHLLPDAQQLEFQSLLQADRRHGFDVGKPPLIRCRCIRFHERCVKVIVTLHHLIVDGQSLQIFLRELVRTYDGLTQGRPVSLPPAVSDRAFFEYISERQPSETRQYWTELFEGVAPEQYFEDLKKRSAAPDENQEQIGTELTRTELLQLKEAARRWNVPVAAVTYGAWALILHRYGCRSDVVFLATRRGRSAPVKDVDRMVGCLINTIPIRAKLNREEPVGKWLQGMAEQWKRSERYEHASLHDIQAWQKQDRGAWEASFLYQHDGLTAAFARTASAGARRHAVLLQHSDFPLTVAVTRANELRIDMQYRKSAFRADGINELLESYRTILLDMTSEGETPLGRVRYLSSRQQHRLAEAARRDQPQKSASLLHSGFERQAGSEPFRIALHDDSGGLSYSELDQKANDVAGKLIASGLRPEEPVGVFMTRSRDLLIALLGTLKAGGCYLPLDPVHPNGVLHDLIVKAGARRVLTTATLSDRAQVLMPADAVLELLMASNPASNSATGQSVLPCSPTDLAYLIPTSGTTGSPKIVEIEHRAAANTIEHSIEHLYACGDLAVVPWLDSPAFDAGMHQIFAPLSVGGALVLVENVGKLASSRWRSRFTAFGATPSVLISLLSAQAFPPHALTVVFGGESYPEKLPEMLLAKSSVKRAINVYGPAEAAIYCTAIDVLGSTVWPDAQPGRTIGKPIRNASLFLLDDALQPVPPGVMGEICVGGAGLARGYRGNPELTAERFVTVSLPDGTHVRVYRTGDFGVLLPDGNFEIHGRRDRQVKMAGVRIELDAIEDALQKAPHVSRAVAFVDSVEGNLVMCACVQTDSDICLQNLQTWIRNILPRGTTPEFITQVRAIPLTPNGKADLRQVRQIAISHSKISLPIQVTDAIESAVVKTWTDLLGHANFGKDDDFFEVGGDSLLALRLLLRIGKDLKVRLTEVSFGRRWTVTSMVGGIRAPQTIQRMVRVGDQEGSRSCFWVMPRFAEIEFLDMSTGVGGWALSAQMDAIQNPASHISDLADVYINEIRELCATGPYHIGGFCFGGYLAFELAARLEAKGEDVTLLLLDRPGPSARFRQLNALVSPCRRVLAKVKKAIEKSDVLELLGSLRRAMHVRVRRYQRGVRDLVSEAALAYTPSRPFHGAFTLVESNYSKFPFPTLLPRRGWEEWSHGPVEIVRRSDHINTWGAKQWSEFVKSTLDFDLVSRGSRRSDAHQD